MIKTENIPGRTIKNVNYFDDLRITAAFHRTFPCEIVHRRTVLRKGAYSLELILNGDVYLYLDDCKYRLTAPCVFWTGDRNETFQFELIPGETYDHYWIDLYGERGRRIYESLCEAFDEPFLKLQSEKTVLPIFESFSRKFKIARTPASAGEEILLVEQLMMEIIKQADSDMNNEKDPYGIEELIESIRKFPFEKYDLTALAKKRGISYIHFRTLFKSRSGKSIKQFILEHQMQTAGALLKSREFRIGELADYCGYPDISSFTRAFKRYYRVSPLQWLKRL